jgi:hypothetical protein
MPYPSLQNIAPHVWGPHGWKFMHAVALAYPDNPSVEEKRAAAQFFTSLEYLLPCESCKQNFRKELQAFPLQPALESKQKLNEWLTTLHNSVNKRLNKTIMSPEQVLEYVFSESKSAHEKKVEPSSPSPSGSDNNTNNTNNNNTWGITATAVAGGLLVAVVVLLVLRHKQKKVSRK